MIVPKTSWGNLVKYVRSPLGFLLAIVVIVAPVVIVALYIFPLIAKYIVFGIFFLAVIVIVVWVIKRTPKTPQGLVATEDYYALEKYLEHLAAYGTMDHIATKGEILKKKKIAGDMALPPPQQPKLTGGGAQ